MFTFSGVYLLTAIQFYCSCWCGIAAFRLGFGYSMSKGVVVLISPSAPSVMHWNRLFDSSLIEGERYMVGVVLFTRVTLPPCGYCLKINMTVLWCMSSLQCYIPAFERRNLLTIKSCLYAM